MESFIKVVEAGSISGAAARMGVAKSVVSRRLKELETHLGVALFNRTTRQMNLTETGRSFYQRCMQILDDVVEAELSASQAHATLKGKLKVAVPLSFGLMHLGSVMNQFSHAHPNIAFDIDFNDRRIDLMEEDFDLAIRIGKLEDSNLIARRLTAIKLVTCASSTYLDEMGVPTTPEELCHHRFLSYSLLQNYHRLSYLDVGGELSSIKLNPYLKANNGQYLTEAAIAGRGIVTLPLFIVYNAIKKGKLVPVLTDYTTPALDAYAVYPQTRHLSQRVRALVDFLVTHFEGVPYWESELSN